MTELLVSVRSESEARLALEGGAGLIDIKEPARGSLGPADPALVGRILDLLDNRCPVSAAQGELRDWPHGTLPAHLERLRFVKWGLAACGDDWREQLADLRARIQDASPCRLVACAYADHRRAAAPSLREIAHAVLHDRHTVFLIDTCVKDGTCLLDWVSVHDLTELVASCRNAGVRIALAGSLGSREITTLARLQPDWFAVRGAVCSQGIRSGELELERVRRLSDLLRKILHEN